MREMADEHVSDKRIRGSVSGCKARTVVSRVAK